MILGERLTRGVALGALTAAALVVAALSVPLAQRLPLVLAGCGVALAAVVLCAFRMAERPFQVMAPAGAALALSWLAALPSS